MTPSITLWQHANCKETAKTPKQIISSFLRQWYEDFLVENGAIYSAFCCCLWYKNTLQCFCRCYRATVSQLICLSDTTGLSASIHPSWRLSNKPSGWINLLCLSVFPTLTVCLFTSSLPRPFYQIISVPFIQFIHSRAENVFFFLGTLLLLWGLDPF